MTLGIKLSCDTSTKEVRPQYYFSLQMLHNKHVMVRVGGGWETFESYLLKHDPCRMLQISRVEGKVSPINSKSPNIKDLTPDSYLVVAAHYRSKKWEANKRTQSVISFRSSVLTLTYPCFSINMVYTDATSFMESSLVKVMCGFIFMVKNNSVKCPIKPGITLVGLLCFI